MATRRYQVVVKGRKFPFSYNEERRTYVVTFGDNKQEGPAATVNRARQAVKAFIRGELRS
jgi:hypothetical protein